MKSLLSRLLSSLSSLLLITKYQQRPLSVLHHHNDRKHHYHRRYYVMIKLLFPLLIMISCILFLWNNVSRMIIQHEISSPSSHHHRNNSSDGLTTTTTTATKLTMDKEDPPSDTENHDRHKPYFVLHVGPPKTATTTIQEILTDWERRDILFQKDRYVYLGKKPEPEPEDRYDHRDRFVGSIKNNDLLFARNRRHHEELSDRFMSSSIHHPDDNHDDRSSSSSSRGHRTTTTTKGKPNNLNVHTKRRLQNMVRSSDCHEQMSHVREQYYYERYIQHNNHTTTISLFDQLIQIPCAKNMYDTLKSYANQRISFLFSDEGMSRSGPIVYRQWTKYDTYSSKYDYISLSILLYPIYQFTVIVTYRRYYEWYISAKQEQERYKKNRHHWNVWPDMMDHTNNRFTNLLNGTTTSHQIPTPTRRKLLEQQQQQQEKEEEENNDRPVTSTTTTNVPNDNNSSNMQDGDDDEKDDDKDEEKEDDEESEAAGDAKSDRSEISSNSSTASYNIPKKYYRNVELLPGLVMEPLFPHYYQTIQPGIVRYYNNPFRFYQENETAIMLFQQKNSIALSKSMYWANTIGIPYHSTATMIRDLYQQQKLLLSHYSDDNIATTTSTNPLQVRIFNLHHLSSSHQYKKTSVRSNFFCSTLPAAFHLCQYSMELDQEETSEKRANPSVDYSIYNQLITAAYYQRLLPYHMIQRGRHKVVLDAEKYHKTLINKQKRDDIASTSNNNTDNNNNTYDIIYQCPQNDITMKYHLDIFLNQSLQYEEYIVPQYYHDDIIQKGKERHIHDYWNMVHRTTKLCSIDTNRTIQQDHWIQFFK